jgi:hypothetical protein
MAPSGTRPEDFANASSSGCSTTVPAWDGLTISLGAAITTTVSALKVPLYHRFDLWLEPIYTVHRHSTDSRFRSNFVRCEGSVAAQLYYC